MKTSTTIFLLLVSFIFVNSTAQSADALRESPSLLELVLNCNWVTYYKGTNFSTPDFVQFDIATNISLEVTFRNVGDNWIRPNSLPSGLSVVWDGKEYKLTNPEHFFVYDGPPFQPKTGWHRSFPISAFGIPQETLNPGRHKVALREELTETNTFIFSSSHEAELSKSNKQIFAESSTLTIFIGRQQ